MGGISMEKITIKEFMYRGYRLATGYRMGHQIGSNTLGHVQASSRWQVQAPPLRHKKTTLNFGE